MNRFALRGHALPLATLLTILMLDVLLGQAETLLGVFVVVPVVAATALGQQWTARYGVAALLAVALMGVHDRQYTDESLPTQVSRLVLTSVGAAAAVVACRMRQQRERTASELLAARAADRAVLEVAETLQRSLLVEPAPRPGLTTAVRYRPATRGAFVGGDWYDVFAVPDGTTMLVIGDVVGHDARAAATMAQARGLLRGLAQSCGSPAAVLAALDRALPALGIDSLATATVATVVRRDGDPSTSLRWSNAGHPPPALVTASGEVFLLERAVDRLLGVSPDTRRADHEVSLYPGDTLLLYTDGLIERRGAGLDDGLAALLQRLRSTSGQPLDAVTGDLLTVLGRGGDDIAVLAVRML